MPETETGGPGGQRDDWDGRAFGPEPTYREGEDAGIMSGPKAWHTMLLRLAGALPDDLITEVRAWLAEGGQVGAAQAVGFAAAAGRVPVLPRDADLMATELRSAGEDPELIAVLERAGPVQGLPLPWTFGPFDPREVGPGGHTGPVDLTIGDELEDGLDKVIVAAVEQEEGLLGVWRAWRTPADGTLWPPPRRVFVVQTRPGAQGENLIALTARLQNALAKAGEQHPQVEVCSPGTPMPGYQSSARAHSALIWAEEPAVPVRIARVFDAVDPVTGPMFADDHPLIEDLEELTALLQYLGSGLPVLTTATTVPDILDPDSTDGVPLNFRTDGHWIWTDTVSYYLGRHGLAPDPELLDHLRCFESLEPVVSDVALHRVLSFLQRPDQQEQVWTVPWTGLIAGSLS